MEMKWKTITFRVSEEYYEQIRKLADETYMTMSGLVRKAIKDTFGVEELPREKEQK